MNLPAINYIIKHFSNRVLKKYINKLQKDIQDIKNDTALEISHDMPLSVSKNYRAYCKAINDINRKLHHDLSNSKDISNSLLKQCREHTNFDVHKTITLSTLTRADIPNVNGIVYSKEVLNKAIKEFKEKGYKIPLTIEDSSFNYDDIDPKSILGDVVDIRNGEIDVDITIEKLEILNEYLYNGYRPGMVYIVSGYTSNNVDDITKILLFCMVKIDPESVHYEKTIKRCHVCKYSGSTCSPECNFVLDKDKVIELAKEKYK